MFDKVMQMLSDSFTACVGWFEKLFRSVGAEFGNFLIVAFMIFTVYRFLLAPIVGGTSIPQMSGLSDTVASNIKRKKDYGESDTATKSKWDEAEEAGLY